MVTLYRRDYISRIKVQCYHFGHDVPVLGHFFARLIVIMAISLGKIVCNSLSDVCAFPLGITILIYTAYISKAQTFSG